jgi:GNAT superfamily N-acetyltransferase
MLLAVASKSLFSPHKTATEIGWYVSPDERGKEAGKQLLEAFEYWAQKVGCKYITMISLDDRVGKFYEKKGYSLLERAYMKVL